MTREEKKVLAAQENKTILQIAQEIVHERRQEKEMEMDLKNQKAT